MPTEWTIRRMSDGSWHVWPHGGGPLRSALGKGWDLVAQIKAEGGVVHWESDDDLAAFTAEFGEPPAEA
jgi:hypothetical protein